MKSNLLINYFDMILVMIHETFLQWPVERFVRDNIQLMEGKQDRTRQLPIYIYPFNSFLLHSFQMQLGYQFRH